MTIPVVKAVPDVKHRRDNPRPDRRPDTVSGYSLVMTQGWIWTKVHDPVLIPLVTSILDGQDELAGIVGVSTRVGKHRG